MADWTKLRGWKYDHNNTYLEVWVDGTEVARFDDATYGLRLIGTDGLTITAGGLTITEGALTVSSTTASAATTSGAIQTDGGVGVAENLNIGTTTSVIDEIAYSGQLVHKYASVQTVAADTTLGVASCGRVIECATDSVIITLPATAPGASFTIVNTGADALIALLVDPDGNDLITGCDVNGSDGKYIINTGSTHIQGDMVQLIGDSGTGWRITRMTGTWDTES